MSRRDFLDGLGDFHEEMKWCRQIDFYALQDYKSRYYSPKQKEFVFNHVSNYGVRTTARILEIQRKTIQRWCRQYGVKVKRCPDWVRPWAFRRNRRKKVWAEKGYPYKATPL